MVYFFQAELGNTSFAVVKENLRLHPGTELPLEKIVPSGRATIAEQLFPEGVRIFIPINDLEIG
ncbi:hypothetical protein F5Y06DRAFT_261488 [Hypoxylon sp. FL0890]|nr:hypothetical protein F5Y06DRAFT_261488 [Hypoxylon sp. FL0890]